MSDRLSDEEIRRRVRFAITVEADTWAEAAPAGNDYRAALLAWAERERAARRGGAE